MPRGSGWSLQVVFVAWAGLLSGCPSTPPASCQDSVCTPKESTCVGNAVAICDADGKGWALSSCGSARQCQGGTCFDRKCQALGLGTCSDAATLEVCAPNGLAENPQKCGSDQTCDQVACVAAACQDGTVECADHKHLFTCTAGAWAFETCADVCGKDAGGKSACVAKTCTPETAWCEEAVAVRCDHTGTATTKTACGVAERCLDGFCQVKLCDASGADASSGDGDAGTGTPDAEVEATPAPFCGDGNCDPDEACNTCALDCGPCLTTPAKVEFKINGVKQTMDIDAKAEWRLSDKTIFIKGAQGLKKIEIHVQGVDSLAVGTWDDTDATGVVIKVCFVDAAGDPSLACLDGSGPGFTHTAILYEVTITDNNGIGSRLEGVFSATLQDAQQNPLVMTDGTFDVQYFD